MANCETEEERARTSELIRPILRGRDIKRYGYEWANLYLIATFPACRYDIDNYPAVKDYLVSFAEQNLRESGNNWVADLYLEDYCKQKLAQTGKFIEIKGKRIYIGNTAEKARKKTSNKWFETQDSISYWEDFYKPKLFYADITQQLNFCLCKEVMFCNNTTYFIATEDEKVLEHLHTYLNSPIVDWYYRTLSVQLGEKAVRMFSIYVLDIPVPSMAKGNDFYEILKLTPSEIDFIECREH